MSFLFNLARDHFSRPKQPKQRSVQSSFDLTFHVKHLIDLQGEAQHRQRQAHHPVKQSAANKTLVVLTQQICFQLLCSTWNTDPQARATKLNVSRETNRHIRSLLAFMERDIRTHWRKDILFHPPHSSARTQRHSRLSSAAKGIAPKFAACSWNSDFPFIPLLQAFDMLCACMHRNSAKNCFTWSNPFKGRKNSPKEISIQDQPAPFIKCEHSVLIGK